MTKIIQTIADWQKLRKEKAFLQQTVGLVPTMGNLHAGHVSLLQRSLAENQITVLSIFVNPTQFNNANDLENYPRTQEQDIKVAQSLNVDFIFMPEYAEMYADNYRYKINEMSLSHELCGKYRPGHFEGVMTVVLKLLHLVNPQKVYFGEKDFQQLQLIKEMAKAFFLDTEVIGCPTVRDENGLARSSRNSRLTPKQYQQALHFPRLLKTKKTCTEVTKNLTELGFKVDYIEEHEGRRLGAVWIDDIRLIDNIPLSF